MSPGLSPQLLTAVSLVFRSHEGSERAVTFVARSIVFVLVQRRVIALLIEGLSTDGTFENVGWTACRPETRASDRSAYRRAPNG